MGKQSTNTMKSARHKPTTTKRRTPGASRARVDRDFLLRMHYELLRVRRVEERLAELYKEQEMRTPTHFSIGQEAIAVGVCAALAPTDVIYSGHRCHAHYLAKGGDLSALVAELYGRETGCAKGRGGSVHLADPAVGMMAASAILGQTVAVAVGSALAFKMDDSPRVAVTFFGDGAVDEGVFHESVNFASVRGLPVVFICENNLYSTHTPLSVRLPRGTQIFRRAATYRLPAMQVDGNDVHRVYRAARAAVERCRRGRGPVFIECMTYRWLEHVGPLDDTDRGYRSRRELEAWKAKDPVKRSAAALVRAGIDVGAVNGDFEERIANELDKAVTGAKESPWPDPRDLLRDVY